MCIRDSCKFDAKFEEQSRQFNELKFDINEVKIKCESECNELKRDIKEVVKSVEKPVKSKPDEIVNTSNITKSSEGIINSSNVCSSNNGYNKEFISDNNDIKNADVIENGISKSDTVDNSSNIESRKLVDVSNEVVISIDELEKEWRDSLNAEYKKRANFSCSIYAVSYTHLDVYKRQPYPH